MSHLLDVVSVGYDVELFPFYVPELFSFVPADPTDVAADPESNILSSRQTDKSTTEIRIIQNDSDLVQVKLVPEI